VRRWIKDDGESSGSLLMQQFEMCFRIASTTATNDYELFQIWQESDNAPRM
jgi:hypothetical protein